MKYEELIEILHNPLISQKQGEEMILQYISQDTKIIPAMLKMLEMERETNKELIGDMNLNLTRNTFHIMHPEMTMGNGSEKQKEFYLIETKQFYKKYEDKIRTAGLKLWDDVK